MLYEYTSHVSTIVITKFLLKLKNSQAIKEVLINETMWFQKLQRMNMCWMNLRVFRLEPGSKLRQKGKQCASNEHWQWQYLTYGNEFTINQHIFQFINFEKATTTNGKNCFSYHNSCQRSEILSLCAILTVLHENFAILHNLLIGNEVFRKLHSWCSNWDIECPDWINFSQILWWNWWNQKPHSELIKSAYCIDIYIQSFKLFRQLNSVLIDKSEKSTNVVK